MAVIAVLQDATLATPGQACKLPLTMAGHAARPRSMLQHAMAANARLLKSFPKGFTLDETHHPHVTMLQQFVLARPSISLAALAQLGRNSRRYR
ncbi:hypothetical protein [Bradyrhizobium sp. Tv2a-2]|uniref:hypothetical protein n=1 Tax=Bradyrhizobium sp. Tv2a-2 TaxID=113395 RepID=UPI000467C060|nr:hypothetical protein [Bradyrhizobium sp. Tv2a-2]